MLFKGRNKVTSTYGKRWGGSHGGIDIVGLDSKEVLSQTDGYVYRVQRWDGKTKTGSQSYGNLVVVRSNGKLFYYAHLAKINVKFGDSIKKGEAIGIMGATGNVTGPHTHFEVRTGTTTSTRVDPAKYCGIENKKGIYKETVPAKVPEISYKKRFEITAYSMTVRQKPDLHSKALAYVKRGYTFSTNTMYGTWAYDSAHKGYINCKGKYAKEV